MVFEQKTAAGRASFEMLADSRLDRARCWSRIEWQSGHERQNVRKASLPCRYHPGVYWPGRSGKSGCGDLGANILIARENCWEEACN